MKEFKKIAQRRVIKNKTESWLIIGTISLLSFALSVVFTSLKTKTKMKKIDMISVLKESFY